MLFRSGQGGLHLVDLGALDSDQSAAQMKDVLKSVLPKMADIYRIYGRIEGRDLSPLTLPPVVALTKAAMFVPEGSIRAGKVNDMVEEAHDTSVSTYIAEGLLALIVLALVIPTGGAVLGIPIAIAGAALSATTAVEDWKTYQHEKMLANSALDRAKALSAGDPSLVPFVFDLITLGLDGAGLVKAFREVVALRNAVRAGKDAKNAAKIDDAVAKLNEMGGNKAPNLGDNTLRDLRAAEHDAQAAAGRLRPPPGSNYETADELRQAVRAHIRNALEHAGDNPEWTALLEHLANSGHTLDPHVIETLRRVHKLMRDPQLLEDAIVELWTTAAREQVTPQQALMRFPGADKSVLSGLMRGVAETRNRPAIVDVPTGRGRVILFATNPCYRWQNHGEFGMLFNTILHHNDIRTIEKKPAQTAEVK